MFPLSSYLPASNESFPDLSDNYFSAPLEPLPFDEAFICEMPGLYPVEQQDHLDSLFDSSPKLINFDNLGEEQVTTPESADDVSEKQHDTASTCSVTKKQKPSYKVRKDVIYKGLLRKCRKQYQSRFLDATKHVKYRKSKAKRFASLKENLKKFCD